MNQLNLSELVSNYFKAYETKERETVEELLSKDFTFSSPVDNQINRKTYFEKCWPSCKDIHEYCIQNIFTSENEAIVRYKCELKSGATFQNTEYFRFNGDQIKEIVVYFGFDLKSDPFAELKVKRFSEAFAKGDADYIIENVAEDVQWHLIGEGELQGREAVISIFEPMRGVEAKEYRTKNLITQGNKAVVEGTMKMPKANGEEQTYAFCDIYTFADASSDTIEALSAYLIELPSKEDDESK